MITVTQSMSVWCVVQSNTCLIHLASSSQVRDLITGRYDVFVCLLTVFMFNIHTRRTETLMLTEGESAA
jgi:hypothetical protein